MLEDIAGLKIVNEFRQLCVGVGDMDKHAAADIIAGLARFLHHVQRQIVTGGIVVPNEHLDADKTIRIAFKYGFDLFPVDLGFKVCVAGDAAAAVRLAGKTKRHVDWHWCVVNILAAQTVE